MVKRELRIEELMRDFQHYVDYFYEDCPFSREQYYLHKKVIEKIRQGEHRSLLSDDHFLEEVREVVSKWIEEWGKGELVDSATFQDRIKTVVDKLQELVGFKLHELNDEKWEQMKPNIEELFQRVWDLKLREGADSQIVTVSKTLHHLLPDLIPPIDRKYTLSGFFGLSYIPKSDYIKTGETKQFIKVMEGFRRIARDLRLTEKNSNVSGTRQFPNWLTTQSWGTYGKRNLGGDEQP